jgi:hypothetical protein
MANPITVDIPHDLGAAKAREKLEKGAEQIASIVPGGALRSERWEGNTLFFEIEALGQRVDTKLEVFDTHVRAEVNLPPIAALFAEKVRKQLQQMGTKLLR